LRWGSGNSDDNRPRWAFKIVCRAALKEVFEKSYGTNEVKSFVSFIKKLGFLKVPKKRVHGDTPSSLVKIQILQKKSVNFEWMA
jgi:hypothetical protein